MKALTTAGLTKLIQLIKSSFISVDDTVTTTTVTLANVATTGDYDDLINKPAEIPSQTGQSGKFLTTDGTDASWATIPTIPDTDDTTVSLNSSDELQAIGVIDKNTGNAKYDWVGTLSEYTTQAVATTHPDWICYITDDDTSGAYDAYTKAEVNSLVASSISTLIGSIYPVGSIYIGTTSTCPIASLITGSTWQLVSSGRVLQGVGTGQTAGVTVEAGLPDPLIDIVYRQDSTSSGVYTDIFGTDGYTSGSYSNTSGTDEYMQTSLGKGVEAPFGAVCTNSIYGNSSTVQPPAYLVNIWERTA